MERSKKKRSAQREIRQYDTTIISCVGLLMITSLVVIFSTTYLQYIKSGSSTLIPTLLQAIWFVLGVFVMYCVTRIDRQTLFQIAPYAYIFGIILLVLVLIFYDRGLAASNGARSWFKIGPLSFQPSELMKFFYILMMARIVSEYSERSEIYQYDQRPIREQIQWDMKFLLRMGVWSILPLALVVLQNDFGTMLVFLVIFVGCVFVSGINWHIILPVFLILAVLFLLLLFLVIYDRGVLLHLGFKEYQFARIDSWLWPFENTRSESYQLSQSLKAIGSGQLFGKGVGVFQVYVPVRESDMVFSAIGENFGFIGSSLLLVVFFVLIFQMISIAYASYDSFYVAAVAGIVAMLTFHIVENVGMSIGLLPLTGIPLPFISQGGSALLTNMLSVGFVLSIQYNQKRSKKEIQEDFIIQTLRKWTKHPYFDRWIWS